MEFIKNMYIANKSINKNDIIKKLSKRQAINNIYCICIDENSNSIMEIIHSYEIHKELYCNKNYIIIGVANDKDEAKELVCVIIKDIYKKDNNVTNMKRILLQSLYKRGEDR